MWAKIAPWYNSGICLEGLKKPIKQLSECDRSLNRDSNPGSPYYKPEMIPASWSRTLVRWSNSGLVALTFPTLAEGRPPLYCSSTKGLMLFIPYRYCRFDTDVVIPRQFSNVPRDYEIWSTWIPAEISTITPVRLQFIVLKAKFGGSHIDHVSEEGCPPYGSGDSPRKRL